MHLLLARLGRPGAEGCRVFKVLYPSVVPGLGAAEAVPALCRPCFSWFWVLWGRQGVDLLGFARFPGFARLKLLAVRAFELGVSGTVEWTLRLWAGLSSTPWFGTALEVEHQCQ